MLSFPSSLPYSLVILITSRVSFPRFREIGKRRKSETALTQELVPAMMSQTQDTSGSRMMQKLNPAGMITRMSCFAAFESEFPAKSSHFNALILE